MFNTQYMNSFSHSTKPGAMTLQILGAFFFILIAQTPGISYGPGIYCPPGIPCHYKPVCGSNGKTYWNYFMAKDFFHPDPMPKVGHRHNLNNTAYTTVFKG